MHDPTALERYITLLTTHDWEYEFSDDHRLWMRGTLARRELDRLREEIDPNYLVWNLHAPLAHRFPWPEPAPQAVAALLAP